MVCDSGRSAYGRCSDTSAVEALVLQGVDTVFNSIRTASPGSNHINVRLNRRESGSKLQRDVSEGLSVWTYNFQAAIFKTPDWQASERNQVRKKCFRIPSTYYSGDICPWNLLGPTLTITSIVWNDPTSSSRYETNSYTWGSYFSHHQLTSSELVKN
ncbi:hypothetical protein L218DRAFT_353114 [Marasmius fiardii PR-910]|nr:hypothetical protein L218DRAFT_353114 [Marasmius fiardii PR-910]